MLRSTKRFLKYIVHSAILSDLVSHSLTLPCQGISVLLTSCSSPIPEPFNSYPTYSQLSSTYLHAPVQSNLPWLEKVVSAWQSSRMSKQEKKRQQTTTNPDFYHQQSPSSHWSLTLPSSFTWSCSPQKKHNKHTRCEEKCTKIFVIPWPHI